MNREEAIRLAYAYLIRTNEQYTLALNYHWTIHSLTEYPQCWYADFRYQHPGGQSSQTSNGAPGFTIDKQAKQIRVISWQELYELNAAPPFC